ncbi:MAG: GHKL domain-containing protein [Acidobacteria bacterium]|nr:GHKL domain-containing protein [Acidobacteriota bacterium]
MARKSLDDGRVRVHEEVLHVAGGSPAAFVTRVAPLTTASEGGTPYAIWMASDVNEAASLQHENELLFERVPCYVAVLDRELRIVRANRRMRDTFHGRRGEKCHRVYKRQSEPCADCPALKVFADGAEHTSEQIGVTATGSEARYIVTAAPLSTVEGPDGPEVQHVIEMSTDVTTIHQLEKEKMDAERLAAVGQTVAGLAHGMKNILMGMEGGIYVMESGMRGNQPQRIDRGMQMLGRNVEKISNLVKNLLGFSKGRALSVSLQNPVRIAQDILDLYGELARQSGVELQGSFQANLQPAPLDEEGIHTCLANLVSNAMDACQTSDRERCRVVIRTYDEGDALCFEVSDNGGGMDYEVKKKIFTTFFTTKGGGGTGLGLLMTRKIVQEHGGRIEVESIPQEGTSFTIVLPRPNLARLLDREGAPRETQDPGGEGNRCVPGGDMP